ncbi:Bardet-Biedl syndrome 1 protein [Pseudomonas aeruginosa]|uniref:Bardet-Biedl syndrome 1 protein n=1 Tax=Pseudomonas aeruginosa TaxID=287 RepID=UPI001F4B2129|nr:Bardet-Biedl syndrome 1 protein [Pseudomonas aeruginosa]
MSKKALRQLADISRATCSTGIAAYIEKHPPRPRAARFLVEFLPLAWSINHAWHRNPEVISHACREILRSRREAIKEVTAVSDYSALRHYLEKLLNAGLLSPTTILPQVLNTNGLLEEKENKIIGHLTLETAANAFSLEEALEGIETQIRAHRDPILKLCKEIVWDGYNQFKSTTGMINNSDIERINLTQDNLDRTIQTNGQHLSFFSPKHPRGIDNIIAYIKTNHSGYIQRRSFAGAHHLNSWGTERIRKHLGITDELAVAAMCIIIDELGFNVSDLQDAKVQTTKEGEFIKILDNGTVRIRTIKPRANALIERNAPRSKFGELDSSEDIDANAAFQILLELRSQHASAIGSNYLFTIDTCSTKNTKKAEQYRMLDTRRKLAFKSIISKLPDWIIDAKPTMPKIRVSNAVLKYLEGGGDTLRSSIYLGNSIQTAIKNYIPLELQEFVHRRKIRDYQNIILLLAEPTPNTTTASNIKAATQLKEIFQTLKTKRLTQQEDNSDRTLFFLCSKENIECVLSYAKYGTNETLKRTCITVINKIESEGSRRVRKILAEAEIKEMDFEITEMKINEAVYQ